MKQQTTTEETKKFLQFNGKNVYFISATGIWWIAIKPICEALGVNYDRQYKNLKSDEILGQLYAMQHIVAADKKLREMVCLPEKYIYGWLFSVQSDSKDLKIYRRECYEVLYDYFHGTIIERSKFLKDKTMAEIEEEKLKLELREAVEKIPAWQKLKELQGKKKTANNMLHKLDKDFVDVQLSLWQTETV